MLHSNYIFHFVSTFAGFHSEIISRLLTQAEFQFRQRFGTWLFLTDVDGRIEAFKSRCEKLMKIESRLRIFRFFCLLYKNFESIVRNFPLCAFVTRRENKKRKQKSIFSRKILFPKSKHVKWASDIRCCFVGGISCWRNEQWAWNNWGWQKHIKRLFRRSHRDFQALLAFRYGGGLYASWVNLSVWVTFFESLTSSTSLKTNKAKIFKKRVTDITCK